MTQTESRMGTAVEPYTAGVQGIPKTLKGAPALASSTKAGATRMPPM